MQCHRHALQQLHLPNVFIKLKYSLKPLLFWNVVRPRLIVCYRHCGTFYQSSKPNSVLTTRSYKSVSLHFISTYRLP